MNLPTRFLPHLLIGIAALAASPKTVVSSDEIDPALTATAEPAKLPATEKLQPAPLEVASDERAARAEQLFWEATRIFSSGDGDFEIGRKLMAEAADLEFPHAQFELGRFNIGGLNGFDANAAKGLLWFERAAQQGLGYAMVAVGQCYYEGTGATKDVEAAARWFRQALSTDANYSPLTPQAGSAPLPVIVEVAGAIWADPEASSKATAHYLLGRIAQENKDDINAHIEFAEAAWQGTDGRDGILDAAREAAYDFACGRGIAQDFEKGRETIEHIRVLTKRFVISRVQSMVQARQIDDFATADVEEFMVKAGDYFTSLYVLGIGNTLADPKEKHHDLREAVKWFELAAERDVIEAKIRLAQIHGGSELGAPNLEQAFKWWKSAVGDNPHLVSSADESHIPEVGLAQRTRGEITLVIVRLHAAIGEIRV
jgi:TPR repeat protein